MKMLKNLRKMYKRGEKMENFIRVIKILKGKQVEIVDE